MIQRTCETRLAAAVLGALAAMLLAAAPARAAYVYLQPAVTQEAADAGVVPTGVFSLPDAAGPITITADAFGFVDDATGAPYVYVRLSVANDGDLPFSIDPQAAALTDDRGFRAVGASLFSGQTPLAGLSLNPGDRAAVQLGFEVPTAGGFNALRSLMIEVPVLYGDEAYVSELLFAKVDAPPPPTAVYQNADAPASPFVYQDQAPEPIIIQQDYVPPACYEEAAPVGVSFALDSGAQTCWPWFVGRYIDRPTDRRDGDRGDWRSRVREDARLAAVRAVTENARLRIAGPRTRTSNPFVQIDRSRVVDNRGGSGPQRQSQAALTRAAVENQRVATQQAVQQQAAQTRAAVENQRAAQQQSTVVENQRAVQVRTEVDRQRVAQQQAAADNQRAVQARTEVDRQRVAQQQVAADNQRAVQARAENDRQRVAQQQAAADNQRAVQARAEIDRQRVAQQQAAIDNQRISQQRAAADNQRIAQQQAAAAQQRAAADNQRVAQQQAAAAQQRAAADNQRIAQQQAAAAQQRAAAESQRAAQQQAAAAQQRAAQSRAAQPQVQASAPRAADSHGRPGNDPNGNDGPQGRSHK